MHIPEEEKKIPGCELMDACGGYLKETGDYNPISFVLSSMKVGRIAVFFDFENMDKFDFGQGVPQTFMDAITFYIGDKKVPPHDLTYENADQSIVVENKYKPNDFDYQPPTGHVILSIVGDVNSKILIKQVNTM